MNFHRCLCFANHTRIIGSLKDLPILGGVSGVGFDGDITKKQHPQAVSIERVALQETDCENNENFNFHQRLLKIFNLEILPV